MILGFFRNFWVSLKVLFRASYDDKDIARYWGQQKRFRIALDAGTFLSLIAAGLFIFSILSSTIWMITYKRNNPESTTDFTTDYIISAVVTVLTLAILSLHLNNYRILRQFLHQKQRLQTIALESDAKTIQILEAQLRELFDAKGALEAEKQREVDDLTAQAGERKQVMEALQDEKELLEHRLRDEEASVELADEMVADLRESLAQKAQEIDSLRAKTLQETLKTATPEEITQELQQRLLELSGYAPKGGGVPLLASEYLVRIINTAHEVFPDELYRFRDLSYVSEEAKRIAQYDSILSLYSEKIAKLRARDMNEEDREEAIYAMKRLRDKEIELLENAEVKGG